MTELHYYRADPTGNVTLIVTSPVPREKQRDAAVMLMTLEKDAEQVGFVEKPAGDKAELRIQMMGGEFCGNATLSAAALCAMLKSEDSADVCLEMSGADAPLTVRVEKISEGEYSGAVNMPLPTGIEYRELDGVLLPIVSFSGISHIISEGILTRESAGKSIQKWCAELAVEALGVMFIDSGRLTPFVYVAATDTAVWEKSCASGTVAVAAYFSTRDRMSGSFAFAQPGGTLSAASELKDGRICSLTLKGRVVLSDEHLICLQM